MQNHILMLCAIGFTALSVTGCDNPSPATEDDSYVDAAADAEANAYSDSEPIIEPTASNGFESTASNAGVAPDQYRADAEALGVDPSEMLAAELVVCREIGDCPPGMTQESARQTICDRTGDC